MQRRDRAGELPWQKWGLSLGVTILCLGVSLRAQTTEVDKDNLEDIVGGLFDMIASSKKDKVENKVLFQKLDDLLNGDELDRDEHRLLRRAKNERHLSKGARKLLRSHLTQEEKEQVSTATLSEREEKQARANTQKIVKDGTRQQRHPLTGERTTHYGKWLEHVLDRKSQVHEIKTFADYQAQRDHVEKCHVCNSLARMVLARTGIIPIDLAVEIPSEQVQLGPLWYHIDRTTGFVHLLRSWFPNPYVYNPQPEGRLVKHSDGQWYAIPRMFGPTVGPLIFPTKGSVRFK